MYLTSDGDFEQVHETKRLLAAIPTITSKPELLLMRQRVTEKTAAIQAQIDEATAAVTAEHAYSDPGWWRAVNAARRAYGRVIVAIQDRIGELNVEAKVRNVRESKPEETWRRGFLRLAAQELPEAVFDDIAERAGFPQDVIEFMLTAARARKE